MLRRRSEDQPGSRSPDGGALRSATIARMQTLILAAEATGDYVGDDFQVVAWVMVGIALVIAAIATIIVTPGPDDHDH